MEELLLEAASAAPAAWDAASLVLSRLSHPGTAFVDAATGATLSFPALRRAALSLASALRLGLGLRRGDAVLVVSHNSLLLPQILLGVLAAGGVLVVVAGDPDAATPAEIAAAAHASGAALLVAAPEAAGKVAGIGVPLLLTSRSLDDPRVLSAEELIEGGDPTAADIEEPPRPSDVAFLAFSSAAAGTRTSVAMTHADLVLAMGHDAEGDDRRVCLASLPMCSAHGLPLLALALPAAGATTVLMPPTSDPTAAREAVAAHAATDVVAGPEAAAALAGPVPLDGKLSTLRTVVVVPFTAEAREDFRRRLPWVELKQLPGVPEKRTEQVAPAELRPDVVIAQGQTGGAALTQQHNSPPADQISSTNEAASPVPPLKKIQKIILGDIFSRSTTRKTSRNRPVVTGNTQAASKL